MSYYCNRRAIKIHQFIPYIELLLCVRHLVVGKGNWAFLKEGCDLLMGVKIMIFWLSGKEQKQSNLGMWGGEGSGEDSVLTRMQGRRIIGEKAWLSVLVPETRWLEATSPSVASPRSIVAPIFPRRHAPIAATVSRAPLHQASRATAFCRLWT